MKNLAVIFYAAFVCAILTAGCGNGDQSETPKPKGDSSVEPDTSQYIEIQLKDARISDGVWVVDAPFDLVVDNVMVKAGQDVKKGDLVFTGHYDPARGRTKRVIDDRAEKLKEAIIAYEIKAEKATEELEDLADKIQTKEDEFQRNKNKLEGLEEIKNKAEAEAERATLEYGESVEKKEAAGLQATKKIAMESAEVALNEAIGDYNDVSYKVDSLEDSVDNLKKIKSNIQEAVAEKKYAREAGAKLAIAQADYDKMQALISQTEFKAVADAQIVEVKAKKGDRLGVRSRVALLVDLAKLEISALVKPNMLKKGTEVQIQMQVQLKVGVDKASCKAIVVAEPERYIDNDNDERNDKQTVRLALIDCATRAAAEKFITKAQQGSDDIQVSLKIKQ